jgi:hypothetical protein
MEMSSQEEILSFGQELNKRKPLPNWIIGFIEKQSRKNASSHDGYVRDPKSR